MIGCGCTKMLKASRLLALLALGVATAYGSAALAASPKPEEKKIPPPEDLVRETVDGLNLAFTYYPSAEGKEAVPVVLLHMFKGKRSDYRDLALYLQQIGHAVVVPDLRGHGESTKFRNGAAIDANRMAASEFNNMWMLDMEAIKGFLWRENNEGRCNLNRLCVVGSEMGASIALAFAAHDWAIRGAANTYPFYGPRQLGAFTKGLVLLSPPLQFKNISATAAIRRLEQTTRVADGPAIPAERIAILMLVGGEAGDSKKDADRIESLLKRYHPEPEGENKKEKKTFFYGVLATQLQGTKLLGVRELRVEQHISAFINLRLIKSTEARAMTWQELKGA